MSRRLPRFAFALLVATTAFLIGAPLVRASSNEVEPLAYAASQDAAETLPAVLPEGDEGVDAPDGGQGEPADAPGTSPVADSSSSVSGDALADQATELAPNGNVPAIEGDSELSAIDGEQNAQPGLDGMSPSGDEGLSAPENEAEGSGERTASIGEINRLAANGDLTLARLSEIAPMALTGGTVSPTNFTATKVVYEDGKLTTKYLTTGEWKEACEDWTAGQHFTDPKGWPGPESGVLDLADTTSFPQIPNYKVGSITVDGSEVARLGNVTVKGAGETPPQEYVYWSASADLSNMTCAVLAPGQKVQVNYVMEEHDITYKVYEKDGGVYTESSRKLNSIFGPHRPQTTVNQWFSTDVTIPAGYIGRVFMGPTGTFNSGDFTNENEKFPVEQGYGKFPLGADVAWTTDTGNNGGAVLDTSCETAPGFYSLSGTYVVGNGTPGEVTTDETVCVVLEKRQLSDYSLRLDYMGQATPGQKANQLKWFDITPLEIDELSNNSNKYVTVTSYEDGTYDCSIELILRDVPGDATHYEMRSLSLNGASLNVPYLPDPTKLINMDGSAISGTQGTTPVTAETELPLGTKVTISVQAYAIKDTTDHLNGGTVASIRQRKYTIKVENAARDLVFDHGTFVNATKPAYTEIDVSKLQGVECEFYKKTNNTNEDSGYSWQNVLQGSAFKSEGDSTPYSFNYKTVGDENGTQSAAGAATGSYHGNVRFKLEEGYNWYGNDKYGTGEHPTVTYIEEHAGKATNANTFASDKTPILGPDGDGWYYVTLSEPYDAANQSVVSHIGYLVIQAEAMQYKIAYQDGATAGKDLNPDFPEGLAIRNMPQFRELDESGAEIAGTSTTVDTNRGKYYSLGTAAGSYSGSVASSAITIAGQTPNAFGERPIAFKGWVVTSKDGDPIFTGDERGSKDNPIMPADLATLGDIDTRAERDAVGAQNYTIYLTALWDTSAKPFSYYVTFNATDPAGNVTEKFQVEGYGDAFEGSDEGYYILKREAYTSAETVNVVFESSMLSSPFADAGVSPADQWLRDHSWYEFDLRKNGSAGHEGEFYWEGVKSGDEIPIWFSSNNGQVRIKKTVEGTPAVGETYEFDVTLTLPADNPLTRGNESEYFKQPDGTSHRVLCRISGDGGAEEEKSFEVRPDGGSGSRTYTGTIELGAGQTASIDLPDGTTYSIQEHPDAGYVITSPADGLVSGQVVREMVPETHEFKNTLEGVSVLMQQRIHKGDVDTATDQDEFSSEPLLVQPADLVDYQITLLNRSTSTPYTVTMQNEVPKPSAADGGDHLKMRLLKHTVKGPDGVEPVITDDRTIPDVPEDVRDGGTITWSDVTVAAGTNVTFSYTAVAPAVEHVHNYTNHATATLTGTKLPPVHSNEVTSTDTLTALRVDKVVEPKLSAIGETFSFKLDLTAPGGGSLPESVHYVGRIASGYETAGIELPDLGDDNELKLSSGSATFELKEGQAVIFVGIPKGAGYTVTETGVSPDEYAVTVTDAKGSTTTATSSTGTIDEETEHRVLFTNTSQHKPVLTVEKTHATASVAAGTENHNVQAGDTIAYSIKVSNTDAKATAKNVTITDTVPEGLALVEGSVSPDGSVSTSTRTITWSVSEIAPEGSATVSFQAKVPTVKTTTHWDNVAHAMCDKVSGWVPSNTVTDLLTPPTPGIIHIKNENTGSAANPEDMFTYDLVITDPNPSPAAMVLDAGTGGDHLDGFLNHRMSIKLKGGAEVIIDGVYGGSRYSVTPAAGNPAGYSTSVTGSTDDVVPPGGTVLVTFVNRKDATPVTPGPVAPIDPSDPDTPPVDPDDPSDPADPSTPDTPATPDTPSTPDDPNDPGSGGASAPNAPGDAGSSNGTHTSAGKQEALPSALPKTGDETSLVLPAALLVLGATLGAATLRYARKRTP